MKEEEKRADGLLWGQRPRKTTIERPCFHLVSVKNRFLDFCPWLHFQFLLKNWGEDSFPVTTRNVMVMG